LNCKKRKKKPKTPLKTKSNIKHFIRLFIGL